MQATLWRVPCREQWSAGTTPNSTAVLPRTRSRQRSVPCEPVVASDTSSYEEGKHVVKCFANLGSGSGITF